MVGHLLLRGLALAAVAAVALGACPNKCSGHGTCGANDVCSCEQNWVNPDCSGRLCPFARAWQDTARYTDDAHYYAECAGRGQCDRTTGVCACDADFSGSGCRRMRCPNDCSGHGVCQYIEELAALSADPRIGGVSTNVYTGWDREKIQGCQCDPFWEGYKCSQRVCPKGDDPLTVNDPQFPQIQQQDMDQAVIVTLPSTVAAVQFVLKYNDPYGNMWSTSMITSGATKDAAGQSTTCTNILAALRAIPNLALYSTTLSGEGQISVTAGAASQITRTPPSNKIGTVAAATTSNGVAQHACIVSFPSAPGTTGLQNMLVCDIGPHTAAGSQPMSAGGGAGSACNIYEHYGGSGAPGATTWPLTELATCSNRGICNSETGLCACFLGHKGMACELQEALV